MTFSKEECEDTGNWTKNCPKCGMKQVYSSWDSLRFAIRKHTICNKCRANKLKTRPTSDKWKRICPACQKEILYKSVKSYLLCVRTKTKCRKCGSAEIVKHRDTSFFKTQEYRKKMSEILKVKRKTNSYGDSFKKKCRINRAKSALLGVQNKPNYNKNACLFIDAINKKFGWNLQHAESGGEKVVEGFFLDGYDDGRNIVFEYDEPKHNTLSHEKRDRIKEKVVIKKISPWKFIRFSEKYNKLYDIINGEEIIWQ
jgi:hypothetical protein